MEYFCVDHPPDRPILCHRSTCEGIADYLEVSEEGDQYFVCAAHTSSERYVSVLPKGIPSVPNRTGDLLPDLTCIQLSSESKPHGDGEGTAINSFPRSGHEQG